MTYPMTWKWQLAKSRRSALNRMVAAACHGEDVGGPWGRKSIRKETGSDGRNIL